MSGFDGAGISNAGFSASGLRGGRQKGSEALAEDFAFVVRADWDIVPGLTIGASFYMGDSGQGAIAPTTMTPIDAHTTILDLHAEWRWRGIEARALYVGVNQADADLINDFNGFSGTDSVGEEMGGHYLQFGYDLLSQKQTEHRLIPFVRYEEYDTQQQVPSGFARDPANDVEVRTYGFSYKPIHNVVLKLDYQDYRNRAGTGTDQWNAAIGWSF